MAFADGFYYEDKDDVEFDKILSSLTGLRLRRVLTLHLYPQQETKGYKIIALTETGMF